MFNLTGNGAPIQGKMQQVSTNFKIDIASVEKAIEVGRRKVTCVAETQSCLIDNQVVITSGSSGSAQSFFSRTSPDVIKLSLGALPATFAAEELIKQFQS